MVRVCTSVAVHAQPLTVCCWYRVQAVELQEELLEEEGWQAEDVQIRCNELRAKLLARIEAGDLLDSDISRRETRREDLDWALRRTSSKHRDTAENQYDGGSQRHDADTSERSLGRGRHRGSPLDDRSTRDRERGKVERDRDEPRRDGRSGGHGSSDMHGSASRHRDSDKAEDIQRSLRYRQDSATEERATEGRYARSHRDDADRYRRGRSRSRERDRDRRSDRGTRGREDDRDSKRTRRR